MTTSTRDPLLPPDRDPSFDAAWHAASDETPPPALDGAILAAAHRAVGAGPQRAKVREATRWERAWWPFAAAATIGAIAAGLLQLAPPDRGAMPDGGAVVSDMPASSAPKVERSDAAKRAAPVAEPAAPAASKATAATDAPATAPPAVVVPQVSPPQVPPPAAAQERSTRARDRAAPAESATAKRESNNAPPTFVPEPATPPRPSLAPSAPPAPVQAPAPVQPAPDAAPTASAAAPARPAMRAQSPMAAPNAAAPERLAQPFPGDSARDRQSASGGGAPSGAVGKLNAEADNAGRAELRKQQPAPLPVDEWIALIRKLRGEGRIDEAAKEIKAFRAAHADAHVLLPPDLRDWRPVSAAARPPEGR